MGTTWVIFILPGCVRFLPAIWLVLSLVLAATAVTEGLVYQQIITNSYCEEEGLCSKGTGARCAIAAMAFWSISSVMTCGLFRLAQDQKRAEANGMDPTGA